MEVNIMKKFILNADDFGMSDYYNQAVLAGYNFGVLKSASLCANGDAFEDAVNNIIPKCHNLSVGVHLNIIEGKSLTNASLLTDKNNFFNNGYISIMKKSLDKEFLKQVENEFRAQIEKTVSKTKVSHLDSHVHTHAIPNLFKITLKLAQEYDIPYVRTQFEKPYIVPNLKKHLNKKYPPNILKIILLNIFTLINKKQLINSGIKTNDYLIGVGYTGLMDEDTVKYGLKALKGDFIAEALIHPCKYDQDILDSHSVEFRATQSNELKRAIEEMNIEIANYEL